VETVTDSAERAHGVAVTEKGARAAFCKSFSLGLKSHCGIFQAAVLRTFVPPKSPQPGPGAPSFAPQSEPLARRRP